MRNLGMAAFLTSDDRETARALKIAVEKDPSDQQSQTVLAMSLFALKDFEGAARTFDQVPELAQNDARMGYEWAYSLAQIHSSQRAAQILDRLMTQDLPAAMLVQVGQLYGSLGDQDRAAQCFQKARAAEPDIKLPQ
jgi:tetratricopeptide (TPR) repeat protein